MTEKLKPECKKWLAKWWYHQMFKELVNWSSLNWYFVFYSGLIGIMPSCMIWKIFNTWAFFMRKMTEIDVRETLNPCLRSKARHYMKIITYFQTTLIFACRKHLKDVIRRKLLDNKKWPHWDLKHWNWWINVELEVIFFHWNKY